MTVFSVRVLGPILAVIAVPAAPGAAVAQGQDFYRQQFNSTVRDLNRAIDRINEVKTGMQGERDFTRGCALLGTLISNLADAQILAEKLSDYGLRAGDDVGHRLGVDQHNGFLEERHHWQDQRSRLCP